MTRLSDAGMRRLAYGLFALMIAGVAVGLLLDRASGTFSDWVFATFLFTFPLVGIIVLRRRPRNTLAWLMLAMGLAFAVPFQSYGNYAIAKGSLPLGPEMLAISGPSWIWFIGISGFLLMLFPDGHLPTRRWRWFAWACGIGLALLFLGIITFAGPMTDLQHPELQNPLGIAALGSAALFLVPFAPLTVVGGAVAVIRRLRREPDPVQRQQLRWLAWAAAIIATIYVFAFVPQAVFGSEKSVWEDVLGSLAACSFVLIPVCIGIAILKYHLYDIDVVIRKTVVFAVLAGFIALMYVALAAATGVFVGNRSKNIGVVAAAVAAAIVALAFQPLTRWARRLADRVVYGKRATPYEVLSQFGEQLGGTYAAEDVLARIAHVLGEGVGADVARVWLLVGDRLRIVAAWPDGLDDVADDFTADVVHLGDRLGALSVAVPASDPMNPTKEKLVQDLAAQAGLVLRNVRLTEELRARLTDLQATQKRLVTAQDEERRKLERNIHDGAQQQLVALTVKLRLARTMLERDSTQVDTLLGQLQGESQQALEDLRDLARGIYPPVLADKGLAAALEAQGRKSPVPVEVDAEGVGRYPREIEAAAYFSCLEAMQNVAKYAQATVVRIELRHEAETLVFRVTDDGVGFDPADTGYGTGLQGIADRLAVLDGSVTVASAPGRGTTVTGFLPGSTADAMVSGAATTGVAASESAGASTR